MKYFKRVINKLNTTSPSIHYYSPEAVDDLLLTKLMSSSITEGDRFGIEYHIQQEGIGSVVFTAPSLRLNVDEIEKVNVPYDLRFYTFYLKHPTFFPIFDQNKHVFMQNLIKIQQKLSKSDYLLIQFKLKKRQGNWRDISTQQFEDYMYGIDVPTSNPIMRKMQDYMFEREGFRKVDDDKFNSIKQKIENDNFQVEIIVGVYSKKVQVEELLVELVKESFRKYNYMNYFEMDEVAIDELHTLDFVTHQKQYFSTNEILAMVEQGESEDIEEVSFTQNMGAQPTSTPKEESQSYNSSDMPSKTPIQTNTEIQKAIDLLPISPTKEQSIDKQMVTNIVNSLKRIHPTKQELIFDDVQLSSTLTKVQFEMPDGIVISNITKKEEDIKAALGVEQLSITQGNKPNTVAFYIPNAEKSIVYLKALLQNPKFVAFAENNFLPFVVGEDDNGNPLHRCLTKMPHLLVAGASGGGKSVWLNQLILTLILFKNPSELLVCVIDPKMVEFSHLKGFPHVEKVITDLKESYGFLKNLIREMEKRYEQMAEKGHRTIDSYNENELHKMPYLVCLVDEYNDLKIQYKDIDECVVRLAQMGRACGIHLIIATQNPKKEVVTALIKTNLKSKISFALDTSSEYMTVFGVTQPYRLLGNGHGVMRLSGQNKEFIQFQGACISPSNKEEMTVVEKLKDYMNGKEVEIPERMEINTSVEDVDEIEEKEKIIEEEPIDKLKRIIASTLETRVSKLQKEMKIRNDKLQDLMYQLVEEGWLYKHEAKSKGYELIAGNDELNKWRDEPLDENVKEESNPEDDDLGKYSEGELRMKIDEALANKDEVAFMRYSKMLKRLKGDG